MLQINASIDVRPLLRRLEGNQKQIAIATAIALTKTAKQVEREEYSEIKRVFYRPTKYTLSGLYVKPATKANLTAKIGIKNDVFKGTPAEQFLKPNIEGGTRRQKRFERAFVAKGIMPQGYYAMPADGAPLDDFGNVPSKFIVQLLSYLGAFGQQGYSANMTDLGRAKLEKAQAKKIGGAGVSYFVINTKSKLHMGIYKRVRFASGTAIQPVFIFVNNANYKRIYNFIAKAEQVTKQFFPLYLKESVQQSLKYL